MGLTTTCFSFSVSLFLHLFFLLLLLISTHPVMCFVEKQIFLLAGQSNMAGQGGVVHRVWDGYVPAESSPRPDIFRLNKARVWEEATEPLHRDVDTWNNNVDGIGPGMPFSTTLLKNDPLFGVIGLVPAALSGSSIMQWQRNSFDYRNLLKRANVAMGEGGVIRGMLWYQGESDTGTHEDAVAYKPRLEQFFNDFRSDLQLPFLPIIQVALATGHNTTNMDIVRKVQLELDMPYVKCVDAIGLEVKPEDPIHLTTNAQVKLGQMLAEAFLEGT